MTGFLLDTNVISELTKDDPDSRVVRFLDDQGDLWLSSVVVYEMEHGLATLPQGRRLARLRALHADILAAFDDRVLSLDQSGARWAAELQAQARRAGQTVDVGDALIAGTAKAHGFAIATRNVRDFQGMDLHIVNPWNLPLATLATPHQPRTTPTPAILWPRPDVVAQAARSLGPAISAITPQSSAHALFVSEPVQSPSENCAPWPRACAHVPVSTRDRRYHAPNAVQRSPHPVSLTASSRRRSESHAPEIAVAQSGSSSRAEVLAPDRLPLAASA